MNRLFTAYIPSLVLFFIPVVAFAAPRTFGELVLVLVSLINAAVSVIIALAVLGFFWGVSKYMFSAQDTTKLEEGKKIMIWGIIALFVMVSVWGILNALSNTFLDSGPTDYESEAYRDIPATGKRGTNVLDYEGDALIRDPAYDF